MTPDASISENAKVDLFLQAGLARVENVFQRTRRLIIAFEHLIGTSSSYNSVWHGNSPYDPQIIQTYLTLFRTGSNFVWASEIDGMTPAMRLGFVKGLIYLTSRLRLHLCSTMIAAWVFFKRLKQRQHHGIGFNAPHYFVLVEFLAAMLLLIFVSQVFITPSP